MSFPILFGRASMVAAAAAPAAPVSRTPESSTECLIDHKSRSRWSTSWVNPQGFDDQPSAPPSARRKTWTKANGSGNRQLNLADNGNSSNEGEREPRINATRWTFGGVERRRRTFAGDSTSVPGARKKRYSFLPARTAPAPPPETPSATTAEAAHATALAKLTGVASVQSSQPVQCENGTKHHGAESSAAYAASRREKRWSALSLPTRPELRARKSFGKLGPVPQLPPHLVLSLNDVAGGMSFADNASQALNEAEATPVRPADRAGSSHTSVGTAAATAASASPHLGEERRRRRLSSRQGLRDARPKPHLMPLVDLLSDAEQQEHHQDHNRAKHRSLPAGTSTSGSAASFGERKKRRKPPPKYEDFDLRALPSTTLYKQAPAAAVVLGSQARDGPLDSMASPSGSGEMQQNTTATPGEVFSPQEDGTERTGASAVRVQCGMGVVAGPVSSECPRGTTPARPTAPGPPAIYRRPILLPHHDQGPTLLCDDTLPLPTPSITGRRNHARDDSAQALRAPQICAMTRTALPTHTPLTLGSMSGDAHAAAAREAPTNLVVTARYAVHSTSTATATAPTAWPATSSNPMSSDVAATALPRPLPHDFAVHSVQREVSPCLQQPEAAELLGNTSDSTRDSTIETPSSALSATPNFEPSNMNVQGSSWGSMFLHERDSGASASLIPGAKPCTVNRPYRHVPPVITTSPIEGLDVRARDDLIADVPLSAVSATFSMNAARAPPALPSSVCAKALSSRPSLPPAPASRAHCQPTEGDKTQTPAQSDTGRPSDAPPVSDLTASLVSHYSDATQGSSASHLRAADTLRERHGLSPEPPKESRHVQVTSYPVEQTPELDFTRPPPSETSSPEMIKTPALPSIEHGPPSLQVKGDDEVHPTGVTDLYQASGPTTSGEHGAASNFYGHNERERTGSTVGSFAFQSTPLSNEARVIADTHVGHVTSLEHLPGAMPSQSQPNDDPPAYGTSCMSSGYSFTPGDTQEHTSVVNPPLFTGPSSTRRAAGSDNIPVEGVSTPPSHQMESRPETSPKHSSTVGRTSSPQPADVRTRSATSQTMRSTLPKPSINPQHEKATSPNPSMPWASQPRSRDINGLINPSPIPQPHSEPPHRDMTRASSKLYPAAIPRPPPAAVPRANDHSDEGNDEDPPPGTPLKKKRFSLRIMRPTKSMKDRGEKRTIVKTEIECKKGHKSVNVPKGGTKTPTMVFPFSREPPTSKGSSTSDADSIARGRLRRMSSTRSIKESADISRTIREEVRPPLPDKDQLHDPFACPPAPPSPFDLRALRAQQSASQDTLPRSHLLTPPRSASSASSGCVGRQGQCGRGTPSPISSCPPMRNTLLATPNLGNITVAVPSIRDLFPPVPPALSPMRVPSPAHQLRESSSLLPGGQSPNCPRVAPALSSPSPSVDIPGVRCQSPSPPAIAMQSPIPMADFERNPSANAVTPDAKSPALKEKRRRRFSLKAEKSKTEHDGFPASLRTAPTTYTPSTSSASAPFALARSEKERHRFSLGGKTRKLASSNSEPVPTVIPSPLSFAQTQRAPTTTTSETSSKRRFSFKLKKRHVETTPPPVPDLPKSMANSLSKDVVHGIEMPPPPPLKTNATI